MYSESAMDREQRPRLGPAAALMILLAAGVLAAPAARRMDDPVSVLVTSSTGPSGARVVLTFSRPVEYRVRESRSRLRVSLREAVDETSRVDQRLSSDVLRRIRFRRTRHGTEIVFYLGRRFDNFSLSELNDPFRVELVFHAPGAIPSVPAPPRGPSPEGQPPLPVIPGFPEDVPQVPEPRLEGPSEVGAHAIVIDPGHGGDEEGAVGPSGLAEKDLVLDLARALRSRLRDAGYTVVLTREIDQAVDLTSRTALANHVRADLFLSIHANSSIRPGPHGCETYFLSYGASAEEAMALARRENLQRGGKDRGRGSGGRIKMVLWEMAQAAHLSQSSRLAELIQTSMNAVAGTQDRGVKQAPFRVLEGAEMPAVLVEVGFLSNPDEEDELAGRAYRERIVEALSEAVQRFMNESDGRAAGGPASEWGFSR